MASTGKENTVPPPETATTARVRALEHECELLQEEIAVVREEWQQEVAFMREKLADCERARQELALWIASVGHTKTPTDDEQATWITRIEVELATAKEEAYRFEARICGLRLIADRLERERRVLGEKIALQVAESTDSPSAEQRRARRATERESNILRGARRQSSDDVRLLRVDLATLLGSRARLHAELERAQNTARSQTPSAQPGSLGATGEPLRHDVIDRVTVACSQVSELSQFCESLEAQISFIEAELSRSIPRLTDRVESEPELTGDSQDAEPNPPATRSSYELELHHQKEHLQHWADVSQEMEVETQHSIEVADKELSIAAAPESLQETSDGELGELTELPTKSQAPIDPSLPGEVLILDEGSIGTDTARRLRELQYVVRQCSADANLDEEIAGRRISSAAINLAMPNAWGVIRRFRTSRPAAETRMLAFALAPAAKFGVWLGTIDLHFLSSDDSSPVERLRQLTPVVKRIVVVSNDREAVAVVEKDLEQSGIGTRWITDSREMEATLSDFIPQAAVIHLSPRCFEAFQIMAVLRSHPLSRDIPFLFVLDAAAHPRDVAFFTAGIRALAMQHPALPASLVSNLSLQLKLRARATA